MRARTTIAVALLVVAGALMPSASAAQDPQPLPPGQPSSGPAGSDYPYPGDPVRSGIDGLGGYTLYEPNPAPAVPVPLVVMLRGACVTSCNMTQTNNIMNAWREHLVKKGNVVLFPHFQTGDSPEVSDQPEAEENNVVGAITAALAVLGNNVDTTRLGFLGHSRGSQMSLNVAMLAAERGIPQPQWLLVVEPGPTSRLRDEFHKIPPDTKIAVVAGDEDAVAGDEKARFAWSKLDEAGHPDANRDFVLVRSHRRGVWRHSHPPVQALCEAASGYGNLATIAGCVSTNTAWGLTPKYNAARNAQNPASATGELVADHFFPALPDALSIHALWKISQALVECTGGNAASCSDALGGTPQQRDMGTWSDGLPVRPLCVTDDPPPPGGGATADWSSVCPG